MLHVFYSVLLFLADLVSQMALSKFIFLMLLETIYTPISILLPFCTWFNLKWLFSFKKHLK